jgi:hypothetical protein
VLVEVDPSEWVPTNTIHIDPSDQTSIFGEGSNSNQPDGRQFLDFPEIEPPQWLTGCDGIKIGGFIGEPVLRFLEVLFFRVSPIFLFD